MTDADRPTPNVDLLAEILRDPTTRIDERDDAAMYLGQSDDPKAVELLLESANRPGEDTTVVSSCGESLGEIAERTGLFELRWLDGLNPVAANELVAWLRRVWPERLREQKD